MAYDVPIGIPAPVDFFSTFGDIDQATPAWPASWTDPVPSATTDKYYIDKTASGATDSGNPYGYPGKARLTVPSFTSMAAGSYVYIHAGTYTTSLQDFRGVGTAADPIWITGNPTVKPILTALTHIGRGATGNTSYMVIENFAYTGLNGSIQIRPTTDGITIDHVIIRNCTITQTQTTNDIGGIAVSFASAFGSLSGVTATSSDSVFTKAAHGLLTGYPLEFSSGTGFGGLVAGTMYWAIVLTASTFQLATSKANALANSPLTISSDGSNGVFAVPPFPNSQVSDVVIYNNVISNIGVKSGAGVSDSVGVNNGLRTNRVWVLDNQIFSIDADSIAGSHFSNYTSHTTENYYIGRNLLYGNGENGIDLKGVRYGIISQNVIYGPFEREQGTGIVLHYGADTRFHCRDCAVIFNLIFHVSGGVGTGSSGVDSCFFIGNVMYDIRASYSAVVDVQNGFTISSIGTASGSNSVQYFVNNTFYDYDRALVLDPTTGDQFICYGNIFSQRWTSSLLNDIEVENGKESMVSLNYNLYDNPTTKILWANAVRNIAYMQGQGQELNAVQGDPDFINGPSANFNLLVGSPAIGASIEGAAYAAYEAMFGVAIQVDYNNNPRPFGGSWDIGAFEYGAGPVPTPPDAPTDLTLVAVS